MGAGSGETYLDMITWRAHVPVEICAVNVNVTASQAGQKRAFMGHGEFLWCDLATFDVDEMRTFYSDILGWTYARESFADGSTYFYAKTAKDVTAGIYEMPGSIRDDGMPSFWMSYIGVDDLASTIELALRHGGKLVLGPAYFGDGAEIAMIEDPFGARFTMFSGSHMQPRSTVMEDGEHFWDELYTSEPKAAAAFYSAVFNWKVEPPNEHGAARVNNIAGSPTTAIHAIPGAADPTRRAFWTVGFSVTDTSEFKTRLERAGGKPSTFKNPARPRDVFVRDPRGAGFFVSNIEPKRGWFS